MQSTSIYKEHGPATPAAAHRTILAAALGLGLAAERLLWFGIDGPGWTLWIALLGLSAVLLVRQARLPWFMETAVAAAIATGAAVIPALRASEALHVLSMLVLVAAASVPLLHARSLRLGAASIVVHALGMAAVAVHAAAGALLFVRRAGDRDVRAAQRAHPAVFVAARGALLAVPPLVIFGALFVSADPLFERYVQDAMRVITEDVFSRIVLALAFTWIAAGLLRALLPARSPLAALPPAPTLPSAEVAVALGAITVLFLTFVVIQARWLFDGAAAIEATTGLTVADYARRGFFELVTVAALTLPLLVAADAVTRNASHGARRALRVLTVMLVLLVFVVMASALERMALYTDRFGLTEQRLYTTAFIGWLAVVFAWFLITFARGKRGRFAAGPLGAGVVAVLTLAVLNPEALIARVNIERAREGAALDAAYLGRLSADAAGVLVRDLPVMPGAARCTVARSLLRSQQAPAGNWRVVSRSEARARLLVNEHAGRLGEIVARECPPDQRSEAGTGALDDGR